MRSHRTVVGVNVSEIVIKRSRFIATAAHVESTEEAMKFIDQIRTKYWDARHNVYAYSLSNDRLCKFSDDGEPHSTAGKPVLDVITGSGLENIAIVVTRYFGGILLGTGGLVRAYSSAATAVINSAEICEMKLCRIYDLECDYSQYDVAQKILGNISGGISDTDFSDNVNIRFYISDETADEFCTGFDDTFSGRIKLELVGKKCFPIKIDGIL